jgi:hypothetical protein
MGLAQIVREEMIAADATSKAVKSLRRFRLVGYEKVSNNACFIGVFLLL